MAVWKGAAAQQSEKLKKRIPFSSFQLHELENMFKKNLYPDAFCRKKLAMQIDFTEARVEVCSVQFACVGGVNTT